MKLIARVILFEYYFNILIHSLQIKATYYAMSDDQLEMLQRELMEVQEEKTNPLSERTVAEILIKLHQKGFRFYSTTDNNQYITPAQLDNEIIKIVQQRGRLSLSILPQLLNLNQDLIESRINGICNRSTHIRHNGWLLSNDYIQNIMLQFKQNLEVNGIVELDEQALTYEFDIKFLQKIVNDHLNMFDADIRDHKMITHDYLSMKKRKVFGFLLAVTRPIEVSIVNKCITTKQDGHKTIPNLDVEAIIRQLIDEKKLKGKFQNLFYIPERFSKNQKAFIVEFFDNNGYLQFTMLQKNYMVPRPEQWIRKNLTQQEFIIFQGICFKRQQLQVYRTQLESLLKGQGYAQISNVIPFDLEERKMTKFLSQNCQLKNFLLNENICYSQQWIEKCVNQFRDRVIFDIFFSSKNKKESKKKGAKKQKTAKITQQELVETLFDARLAQYSAAEEIADSFLPILLEKLQQLKVKVQKELTQSQGVINTAFLKYRKCKSIVRSEQNSIRVLNTIEKQKKKMGPWIDPDFGPNQNDTNGQYSLVYYDGIIPKDWPIMQNLKWRSLSYEQLVKVQSQKSKILAKCLLIQILQIIEHHNKICANKIKSPIPQTLPQQPPYIFTFHASAKQPRYVFIDNRMPYFAIASQVEDQPEQIIEFSSKGMYGLVEKAYSKFRYCYKSLLSVSFHDLVSEITAFTPIQKIETNGLNLKNKQTIIQIVDMIIDKGFKQQRLVVVLAEGKKNNRKQLQTINEQIIEIQCLKPYSVAAKGQNFILFPGQYEIKADEKFVQAFNNIWIIGS